MRNVKFFVFYFSQHLPKTVSTLRHVCLFYHFETNGTVKRAQGYEHDKTQTQKLSLQPTNQTKSLLLSSYEFKSPLYRGAWCRDLFLLLEDAEGLFSDANPPRGDGTADKVGTDKPLSTAAVAGLREGTTFAGLLPLLVTALLPPPPAGLVLPEPPLLLLVPGTELAPPAFCCGRLLDIAQGQLKLPQNPLRCRLNHPDCTRIWLLSYSSWLTSLFVC